jgi:hypothetical protein
LQCVIFTADAVRLVGLYFKPPPQFLRRRKERHPGAGSFGSGAAAVARSG